MLNGVSSPLHMIVSKQLLQNDSDFLQTLSGLLCIVTFVEYQFVFRQCGTCLREVCSQPWFNMGTGFLHTFALKAMLVWVCYKYFKRLARFLTITIGNLTILPLRLP